MNDRAVRVVLQARTTSSRLPAKVLLPVGGLPLAVLCARRLANTGREVVLATSGEASDDLLAGLAEESGIRVCRGDLSDVLGRFVEATADLGDGDLVVRATADNPLPDGDFVDRMVEQWEERKVDYLGTCSPEDGLPYGMSAEVFLVSSLRRSASASADDATREHVTVEIRRNAGLQGRLRCGSLLPRDLSDRRVTIDTLDDYLAMAALFRGVSDPVREGWRALLGVPASNG